MAWVETRKLRNGEHRYRVVERTAEGRLVKGPSLLSLRDAQRLAGRTGLEKQRDALGLVRKDFLIRDLVEEIPLRLEAQVAPGYIHRVCTIGRHLLRFLDARARRVRYLSELTKPVLLEYRRFRLDEAAQPRRKRELDMPVDEAPELTIAQAARVLGYQHSAVLRLVTLGILSGRKVQETKGRSYYLVTRASLDGYRASDRFQRGQKRAAANAKRRAEAAALEPPQKHLKNRTINSELTTIRTLLNKAVEWGLLDDAPIANTKGLLLPEHDSKEFRALTDLEFERFKRVCPAWLLPPVMAAALLGLREDEVRQLEWTDIDLQSWTLNLRNKPTLRLKSQGHTGVRAYRMPIPRAFRPILSELQLQRNAYKDALVFHDTVGRQWPRGGLRKRLIHVLRQCEITDVTQFHALRKTFITHMARRVDNVFLLQNLARHRDIRTTARYVNVFEEDRLQALEGFDIGTRSRQEVAPGAPGAVVGIG